MSENELLDEIKSRAYWRIEIHSTEYSTKVLPDSRSMQALLNKITISFRGWPYPDMPQNPIYTGEWLEGSTDWENYKEYWRLYESGQWIHYLGVSNAWVSREVLFKNRMPLPPQHAGYLHIRGDILFDITEIYRFAVGLAQNGIISPTAYISIQLHNAKDYMLFEDFERPYFLINKFVNLSGGPIKHELKVSAEQLTNEFADKTALEFAVKVCEVFNYAPAEAGVRMMAEDQIKLIERRL